MTPFRWIAGVLVVGLVAVTAYLAQEVRGLTRQIEKMDAALAEEVKTRTAQAGSLRTDVIAQSERITSLGTTDEIVRRVAASSFPLIVEGVATTLVENPKSVERLRGLPGPTPDVKDVVKALLDRRLVSSVADEIWSHHYKQLAVMPEVVATVAEKVYQTYGKELKGADGKSPEPSDIVAALAAEPAFLELIALDRKP